MARTDCQPSDEEDDMSARIDVIGVVVDDMARSLAFYRELGLEIPAEKDSEPHVEVEVAGGMRLAFDTVETIHSFYPEWEAREGHNRVEMAFLCDSPADVNETYERLVAKGYTGAKEPWDAFWGQRYAIVEDPDGNGANLFAPNA
jgi:catechol 2,3-dioxygenase-like lactoylglutathione lyase family enzyme